MKKKFTEIITKFSTLNTIFFCTCKIPAIFFTFSSFGGRGSQDPSSFRTTSCSSSGSRSLLIKNTFFKIFASIFLDQFALFVFIIFHPHLYHILPYSILFCNHIQGGPKKSLLCDLEEKCLKNYRIFLIESFSLYILIFSIS